MELSLRVLICLDWRWGKAGCETSFYCRYPSVTDRLSFSLFTYLFSTCREMKSRSIRGLVPSDNLKCSTE